MVRSLYIFIFALLLSSLDGWSQESPQANPYQCIYNHLLYLQDDSYDPTLSGRSFVASDDSLGNARLAIKLKQVYDGMGLFVRLESIPETPDYRDTVLNEAAYYPFPKELPSIYVVKRSDGWYYSEESKSAIPKFHKKVYPLGTDALLNLLPQKGNNKVFGLYTWQYLGFGFIALICIGLFLILRFVLSKVLRRLYERDNNWRRVKYLVSFWATLLLSRVLFPILLLPPKLMEGLTLSIKIVLSFLFLLILLQLINILVVILGKLTEKTESKMDEQLLPVLKRGIQFIILVLWLLHLLSLLGVNITALIAGISIGGLALALAAQDTLKNLFGSLTIFLDKPFQIGDWVKSGDAEGTVEEVGFRSTRIRSFANSVIYVPNSKISDTTINNFGLRKFRRFNTTIGIKYDTPPDKIDAFVQGLRNIVAEHPKTRKDAFEIHLNNLGASALEILFYIFFEVDTWTEELESKHEIIMSIIRLADSLGVGFAFPSTSVYLEK